MRNVTVYENKDVVMDGQLVKKVLSVTAPTLEEPIARIELHIDGALTFTPEKYTPPPVMPTAAPEPAIRSTDVWHLHLEGYIDYDTYKKIMGYYFPNHAQMKPRVAAASVPPPPAPPTGGNW
jgi:hypothetical protein